MVLGIIIGILLANTFFIAGLYIERKHSPIKKSVDIVSKKTRKPPIFVGDEKEKEDKLKQTFGL
jgi:nucleoside recognition membrane protein YjiH